MDFVLAMIDVAVIGPGNFIPVFRVEFNASGLNDNVLICLQLILNIEVNSVLDFILFEHGKIACK